MKVEFLMMTSRQSLRPYLIRLAIVLGISIGIVAIFNEAAFLLLKDNADRAPKTIQIIIPKGTAERVKAGEDVPSIPEEMVFVVGDVLEVKNEDIVNHQLGPLWVPPGTSARLVMEKADKLAFSCSFQTSQYLGLDIRNPTTLATRFIGVGIVAPTFGVLVFIYSLLVFPINKQITHPSMTLKSQDKPDPSIGL